MKILSINISHNPSICVYENKRITHYFDETRFVLKKGYTPDKNLKVYQSILQKINFKPDFVCYVSYGRNFSYECGNDQDIINCLQKQLDNPPYYFNEKQHHIYHAISSFYFSDFDEAAAIIVDGGGACASYIPYQEIESIYLINKKNVVPFYKHSTCMKAEISKDMSPFSFFKYVDGFRNKFSNEIRGGAYFTKACGEIGYAEDGENSGKVMGLSSYAYTDKKYNLDYDNVNIAKEVQEKTYVETCELINQVKHKSKNIVLSGGYFLNCSNNFKYVKQYPELNFFVDPIPHDGGTAIGAALYYDNYRN